MNAVVGNVTLHRTATGESKVDDEGDSFALRDSSEPMAQHADMADFEVVAYAAR